MTESPARFWEERYAGDQVWSGKVNQTLREVISDLGAPRAPGRALDLGCGEGGDVVWLAEQGWQATGIDLSPSAVSRAQAAAEARGVAERTTFRAADLDDWEPDESYDLVTACFFQSPVGLDRVGVLSRAAAAVATAGRLLIVSHAAPPPWASRLNHEMHRFLAPAEELAQLELDGAWKTELCEVRRRTATGPEGEPALLDDGVVLLQRG